MSDRKYDSAMYTKNRTVCCIPEEILQEYSVQSKWKQTDELYEKVKQKIMKLPDSKVEKKIEHINFLLQNILDDKELTVSDQKEMNSGFFVREHVLGAKETFEAEKKDYNAKILELMKETYRTYSKNLKLDTDSLKRARINFRIPNEVKIYYVFDWTLLGNCKEGLAICSDGLHYKFDISTFSDGVIKWESLSQYDIQLYGAGKIRLNAKWNRKDAVIYFMQNEDAVKFIEILHKMQKV